MRLPLLFLTLYLGTSPVHAGETPADSTRGGRPTFSMAPT